MEKLTETEKSCMLADGSTLQDLDRLIPLDPILDGEWSLVSSVDFSKKRYGVVYLTIKNPVTYAREKFNIQAFAGETGNKRGGVYLLGGPKDFEANDYRKAVTLSKFIKLFKAYLKLKAIEFKRDKTLKDKGKKAIDQVKILLSDKIEAEDAAKVLFFSGSNTKKLSVIIDKASRYTWNISWSYSYFKVSSFQNGSGISESGNSREDLPSLAEYITKLRKIIAGKKFKIKQNDLEFEVCLDNSKEIKTAKGIKSAFDCARYWKANKVPPAKKIELLKEWFTGKTIRGTLHDYEWGDKSITINITSSYYEYSLGREEYFKARWSELKPGTEKFEEFFDYASPFTYIREALESGERFEGDVIEVYVAS